MSKQQTGKTLYDNDLKYRKAMGTNYDDYTLTDEQIEELKYPDNIDYRLKCCRNEGYRLLDLNYMDITTLPKLEQIYYDRVEHLTVTHNKLKSMAGITKFKILKVLDVSDNELEDITGLPDSVMELSCDRNNISKIETRYDNLRKLSCSYNNMSILNLSRLPMLNILIANNNKISGDINMTDNKLISKINMSYNKIKQLRCSRELVYCNVEQNGITKLDINDKIRELIINNNPIRELRSGLTDIRYIEMVNTYIAKLEYYPELRELMASIDHLTEVSNKYKDDPRIKYELTDNKYFTLYMTN